MAAVRRHEVGERDQLAGAAHECERRQADVVGVEAPEREAFFGRSLVRKPGVGNALDLGQHDRVVRRIDDLERDLFLGRAIDGLAQVLPALAGERELLQLDDRQFASLNRSKP